MQSPAHSTSSTSRLSEIFWLIACLILFYGMFLGSRALNNPDESRYSEVSREMTTSGDYVTPTVNGVPFLDKPPLIYWFQAAAIKSFGLNEWALRLIPALFAVFGILMTYVVARVRFGRPTAIMAALILATSPLYFFTGHYVNMDMAVAALISASLLCFNAACPLPLGWHRRLWMWGVFFFAAWATLTKGLIGIVLPGTIIFIWMVWWREWRILKESYLFSGLLLYFAIVTPWFYKVAQANPEFIQNFFIYNHFQRYLDTHFNNPMPFWFYIPLFIFTFLPWTLFLPYLKRPFDKDSSFFLIWGCVIILFFSIPHSKLVSYILPAYPPFAVLVALTLNSRFPHFRFKKMIAIWVVLLLIILKAIPYFVENSTKSLALQLKEKQVSADQIYLYGKYYQDFPLYFQSKINVVENWDPASAQDDNWKRDFLHHREGKLPPQFVSYEEFWQRWSSQTPLYAIMMKRDFEELRLEHTLIKIDETKSDVLVKN